MPPAVASQTPDRPAFRALTSPEEALGLAFDVLFLDPGAVVVALVEDRARGRGLAVSMCGPAPADAVARLAGGLVAGLGAAEGPRVAYVSLLEGASGPEHEAVWRRLVRIHEEGGVPLLDWMTLSPGLGVTSYAETCGPKVAW